MRILLADDHELMRRGIRSLLRRPGFEVCGEAVNGSEAVEKAVELKPDVVIMDISMPLDGLEATRTIRRILPQTSVLILSQHDTEDVIRHAMNAGASAYVVKSAISSDLLSALDHVKRGEPFFPQDISRSAHGVLDAKEILQRSAAIEKALRQSEERLNQSLDHHMGVMANVAEGLYTVDTDGIVTSLNPAAEALFGWSKEELLGKKIHDITHCKHPDGSPFPAADCPGLGVLRSGVAVREHEDFFIRRDGSFFPVVFSAAPLLVKGTTVGIVVSFRDDTERRASQAALRQSEQRLREIINALPAAIYTTDVEGYVTHFNPAAVEFSGRVPALGTDRWCVTWKLMLPDGTPLAHEDCPMAVALREGRIQDGLECIAERPDGKRRWFTPFPRLLRTRDGSVTGGINMLVDITERKHAEQAQALLAAIVDSSDDAIISKSLDGIITSWNRSAERLFGFTPREAIGKHITLIIPRDRRDEEGAIIEHLRRGERVDHFETVRMRKDGAELDISLTISPIKDASGKVVGASKVARDISDRKRTEYALQRSEARLANEAYALARLNEWSARLWSIRSLDEGLNDVLAAVIELLGADKGDIQLVDSETGSLVVATHRGFDQKFLDLFGQAAMDSTPSGRALSTGAQVAIEDTETDEKFVPLRAAARNAGFRSVVSSPMIGNDRKVLGVISAHFQDAHRVDDQDLRRLGLYLRQAADFIQRCRIEDALRESEDRYRALAEELESQVLMRTRELEERSAHVIRQSDALRDLSFRLLQTQDEERRRIARELHDSAGQTLTVLGLSVAQLVRKAKEAAPQLAKDAEESQQLVQHLNTEIRTASYLLHPPLLDESGLSSALRWYTQGLTERTGLDICLNISEEFGRLPSEMELLAFRLVQECLTNIHRHADSKSALISINRRGETVLMEVRDHGKGIPPEKLAQIQSHGASGVGIRGMRERVRQFHGEVNIESSNSGTAVLVTIPIPNGSASAERANCEAISAVVQ